MVTRPKTVFTFDILETFHELSLQGKTTTYDFYHSVIRRTDNLQLGKPIVGYSLTVSNTLLLICSCSQYRDHEFARVMRLWRHLKMLKQAGRGQDPSGAEGTQEGELAIECPACPHPDRNLPSGWERAVPEILYVISTVLFWCHLLMDFQLALQSLRLHRCKLQVCLKEQGSSRYRISSRLGIHAGRDTLSHAPQELCGSAGGK